MKKTMTEKIIRWFFKEDLSNLSFRNLYFLSTGKEREINQSTRTFLYEIYFACCALAILSVLGILFQQKILFGIGLVCSLPLAVYARKIFRRYHLKKLFTKYKEEDLQWMNELLHTVIRNKIYKESSKITRTKELFDYPGFFHSSDKGIIIEELLTVLYFLVPFTKGPNDIFTQQENNLREKEQTQIKEFLQITVDHLIQQLSELPEEDVFSLLLMFHKKQDIDIFLSETFGDDDLYPTYKESIQDLLYAKYKEFFKSVFEANYQRFLDFITEEEKNSGMFKTYLEQQTTSL